MDSVFTTVSVILSPDFTYATNHKTFLNLLGKLRLVTGVQFTCRARKTYALHGSWDQVNAAHNLLGHWNLHPTHEPIKQENGSALELCDCPYVDEILARLESIRVQSETESRNVNNGSVKTKGSLCINNAAVKRDIEYLASELKSRKNTDVSVITSEQLDADQTFPIDRPSPETTSPENTTSTLHPQTTVHNKTTHQESKHNQNKLTSQQNQPKASEIVTIGSPNFINNPNESIKDIDINNIGHEEDPATYKSTNTKVIKSANSNSNNLEKPDEKSLNNPGKALTSKDVKGESSEDKPDTSNEKPVKKEKRKPGDKGYWSRAKRSDQHSEHMCPLCGVVLKSRKRFLEHKRRMHLKEYTCSKCNKGFGYPSDLAKHKCQEVEGVKKTAKVKETKDRERKEQVYKCVQCSFTAASQSRLDIHTRLHRVSLKCDLCDRRFSILKSLEQHRISAHRGKNYVCEKCPKRYESKRHFDLHMKTHEDGYTKPTFMCAECGKIFTTRYALTVHTKTEHLGLKQTYLCQICGKRFRQRNSYKQHTNVHNGIKPYKCNFCGKAFAYHKSLKEHKFMHDEEKKFKCDICGKLFRQLTCLKVHIKTHKLIKDHTCSVCGKEFIQKQALVRHERIHSGIRPFKCLLCQKEFNDSSSIRRHILTVHKKTNWKQNIICSLKRNSDYYVLGGPGQNRDVAPYGPKKSQQSEEDDELKQLSGSQANSDVSKSSFTIGTQDTQLDTVILHHNNSNSDAQSSIPHSNQVFATLTSPPLQVQYKMGNQLSLNYSGTSQQSTIDNMGANYIAIPNSTVLTSNDAIEGIGSNLHYQNGSFQFQGSPGQLVDLSSVTLLPAKVIEQPSSNIQTVPSGHLQSDMVTNEPESDNLVPILPQTFIPVVQSTMVEYMKPTVESDPKGNMDASTSHYLVAGNVWGLTEGGLYALQSEDNAQCSLNTNQHL